MTEPELSVVVTVTLGGETLIACLEALAGQIDAPAMEVIVPYDDTIAEVAALSERFPEVQFLAVGHIAEAGASRNAYWEHVRYDFCRAFGLRAAQGRLIAMVQDQGWPKPDWARTMAKLHRELPNCAIGGVVECAVDGAFGLAVFLCDYGRYEAPLTSAHPDYVSDVNICYKRAALERVRPHWQERYQEAAVNWAIQSGGDGLYLSEKPVVVMQSRPVNTWAMLMERWHWGRTYGHVRVRESVRWKGILWAAAFPLLPFLLFYRHYCRERRKHRSVSKFLGASPALFLLLTTWSLGECIGYCEAALRPESAANRPGG